MINSTMLSHALQNAIYIMTERSFVICDITKVVLDKIILHKIKDLPYILAFEEYSGRASLFKCTTQL